MKTIVKGYCAECRRDFTDGEIVNYTWYENAFFCDKCKAVMNMRVTPAYLDWEERKVKAESCE